MAKANSLRRKLRQFARDEPDVSELEPNTAFNGRR
jgi:hypothetical protein